MPHQPTWRNRLARCGHVTALPLLVLAAITLTTPASRAAEPAPAIDPQSSAASETPSPGAGPLTPVHRDLPAPSAQSAPFSKQAPAVKKPTITLPPPAATPSADATPPAPASNAGQSQPKQAAETASPASPPKAAKPQPKQAEAATPPRPHRKPASTTTAGDRRMTEVERSWSVEVDQTPGRDPVYREDYGRPQEAPFAYRQARPYPPPPGYGDEPGEMGPARFAPPWYYRDRPLAWGPYPGMRMAPPGPW